MNETPSAWATEQATQLLESLTGYQWATRQQTDYDEQDTAKVARALDAARAAERERWLAHIRAWLSIFPPPDMVTDDYERGCAKTLANLLADMVGDPALRARGEEDKHGE